MSNTTSNTTPWVNKGRLRAVRRQRGLTVEKLAVAAGVSSATVYLSERAPNLLSKRTAAACAAVLGVPVEELLPTAEETSARHT
jgi:transcriptional regulator with XRE-family HTH domain